MVRTAESGLHHSVLNQITGRIIFRNGMEQLILFHLFGGKTVNRNVIINGIISLLIGTILPIAIGIKILNLIGDRAGTAL